MFIDLDDVWRYYLSGPDSSRWTITFVVVLAIIWGYQFVQLMLMADEDFPGRFDKLAWSTLFVLAMPLAPFAFLVWRGAYKENIRRRSKTDFDE
jgi:hypothetical protein